MIEFKTLELTNFASYTNTTKFDFTDGISQIIGENGSGKSTIVTDALMFACYGYCYKDVKLEDIINDTAKTAKVELTFIKNNKNYKIIRSTGESNIFEIYEDGVLLPMSPKKKSYQLMLEENILELTPYYFELIVIKSLMKNKSFLNMKKAEKTEFIENVFNIDIITKMEELSAEKAKNHNVDIKSIESEKAMLTNSITNQRTQLNKLIEMENKIKNDETQRIAEEVGEMDKQIAECQKIIDFRQKANEYINNTKNKINQLKVSEYNQKIADLNSRVNLFNKKSDIFNDECKNCPNFKKIKSQNTDVLVDTIKKLNILLSDEKEVERKLLEDLSKFNGKMSIINEKQSEKARLELNKQSLLAKLKEVKTKSNIDDSLLKELLKKEELLNKKYDDMLEYKKHLEAYRKLLPQFKLYVIKKYLPLLNRYVNYYLQKFKFPVSIIFDDKFNEKVTHIGKSKVSFNRLSEGQKQRVNLSLLFAFVDLCQIISKQTTNLLVLDELESTISNSGLEILLDIIKEKHNDKNVVFISHKPILNSELIHRKYNVTMTNYVSEISQVM